MQNINISFPLENPDLFQPTLEDDLVLIRPIRAEDFEGLYAVASDPLLWEQHPAWDRYKLEVFTPLFQEALACRGGLTIVEKATGEIIGSSRYYRWNEAERSLEIGWSFIARRCWGGRYNTAVKCLMTEYAFTFANSIDFYVGPTNWRSQKAVLKLGAVEIEPPKHLEKPTVVFRLEKK